MDGWCDQTKKLSEELDLTQGVNIIEREEDEGWRGRCARLDNCCKHTNESLFPMNLQKSIARELENTSRKWLHSSSSNNNIQNLRELNWKT